MTRILVADDRAVNRQFLTTLLGYFDYQVQEAAEGQEALDVARKLRPDLVIADILMPGMDGFELARQMKADRALASIPVIFYSATYRVADARTLAEACGVKYVIGKPSEPKDILAIVAKVLAERPTAIDVIAPADMPLTDTDEITDRFLATVESLETTSLRLSSVIELSLNLAAERDPHRLLAMFCRATRDILGARRVVVAVTDGARMASVNFVANGFDEATEALLRISARRDTLLRDPPLGRHTLLRENPGGDPEALGLPDEHPSVYSFLAAPLHVAGRDLGWVYLADKLGKTDGFGEEDRRLVQTLAAIAAVAYDSLHLYNEVSQHAEKLRFEVAERRTAECEALAREAQLAGLATNLPGVVYQRVRSPDGRISYPYVSRRAEEFCGYAAAELTSDYSSRFSDAFLPESLEPFQRSFDRSAQDLSTMDFDYQIVARDGVEKWARTIATPRLTSERAIVWDGIVLDITSERRIARERRALEDQLRQSQKLAAVGTLTGGMAHDFNNLLLVILGNSEMLADRVAGDATALGMTKAIAETAERGAELIRLLLAFARQQPLRPARFDVGQHVERVLSLMKRMLGEQIRISIDVTPNLWHGYADSTQLEVAVANLATNARDAMPEGGFLRVNVHNATLDTDYCIRHPEAVPGEYTLIEVSDSGIGMSSEVQSRAFEPFFTTKEVDKGTGLGLSMIYGFALQSGGHISLYSEEGVGTTARLYIPRAKDSPTLPAEQSPVTTVPGGSEVILVVDDKEDILKTVVFLLRSLGYRVLSASATAEALALLLDDPTIDLLLTDVVMPGMSGPNLASEAMARCPRLKVLYSSGFPDAARASGPLPPGSRLLSKPFRRNELAQKVRAALDAMA